MKKKIILAILAMGVVLGAAGCGGEETKENSTAGEMEAASKDSSDEAGESTGSSIKDAIGKKDPSVPTRLVSVDDVSKYIEIGEYKGITLDNVVTEVTEEDIDFELENVREEVTNGTAEVGDMVTVSFIGTKDGVPFEGGSGEDYEIVIGDGFMLEEFEQGIVGMKKGETKDVELTFPEDYGVEELDGQPVVFQITLQKITRAPELTDEWVAANTEVKTVEEYRNLIREKLEADNEYYASFDLRANAWYMVYDASEVKEYPETDLEAAAAEYRDMYAAFIEDTGMTLEEFVESQGMTMEEYEDDCQIYAEDKVKQNLILQGIMDAEGITLDDPKCLEYQDDMIVDYGVADLAELIDTYGQAYVDESIAMLLVEDLILENAEINELIGNGVQIGEDADIEDGYDTIIEDDMEIIYEDDMLEEFEAEELPIEELEELESELVEDVVVEE